MKNTIIFRAFIILIVLLSNTFAEEISKVEKDKRKIVSRMYQATYAILEICPDREVNSYKKIIDKFERTYPEFTKLLNESPYHQYVVDTMKHDIDRERQQSDEIRMSQCSFGKSITESLMNSDNGVKSVSDMLETLRK
jgi:hypothetical protein